MSGPPPLTADARSRLMRPVAVAFHHTARRRLRPEPPRTEMRTFQEIYADAAARKGGEAALEALIAEHRPKSRADLAATPDHRWLAQMSKCVFQAGFNWKIIEAKWAGFERAFHGFDPPINAAMSDDEFDAHLRDASI